MFNKLACRLTTSWSAVLRHIKSKSSLARNFSTLLLCTIIGSSLGLFSMVLLAKYMGPSEFGLFSVSLSLINIAIVPASVGLNAGVVYKSTGAGDTEDVLTAAAVCGALYLAVLALGCYLGKSYLPPGVGRAIESTRPYVVTLSLFTLASGMADAYLRATQKIRQLSFIRLTTGAINLFVAVGCVALHFVSANAPLLAKSAECLVFFLLATTMYHRRGDLSLRVMADLAKYAAPASLGVVGMAVFCSADKLVIGEFLDSQEVGLYSMMFFVTYTLVSRFVDVVLAVFFSSAISYRDKSALAAILLRSTVPFVIVSLPMVFVITIVVGHLLGDRYSVPLLMRMTFTLGGVLFFVAHLYWWFIGSLGGPGIRLFALFSAISSAVVIAVNFMLLPMHGITGATVALALGTVFLFISGYITVLSVAKRVG